MGRNKPSKKTKRDRTDREKLELFVSKVNDLRQTRLSKKGFRIYHNLHYQRGKLFKAIWSSRRKLTSKNTY